MGHAAYLTVLCLILCGALWLEVIVRTRVLIRFRRTVLSIVPVSLLFTLWDWYAASHGHWYFESASVTGIKLTKELPIEEILFFVVVPLAAILTLEAVRAVRGWQVGDEAPE